METKPNASREWTDEEEAKLFETGEFGNHNPLALQRTLWWFLSMQFGFRARDESRKLCLGDIVLDVDAETGREVLVWTAESGSKTRQGLEGGHQRQGPPLRPPVLRKLTAQNRHCIWQLITKPGAKATFGTRAHHSARIMAPCQFANKSFTHRCFQLRARRDQVQIPLPNSAKVKAFSQEQQSAQWTTVFLISFHQARQSAHALMIRSRGCLTFKCGLHDSWSFPFLYTYRTLSFHEFWTFLNMAHLHVVFTFSESLCYVLLFSWANKNFLFWQLSHDCQFDRTSCFRSLKQEEAI